MGCVQSKPKSDKDIHDGAADLAYLSAFPGGERPPTPSAARGVDKDMQDDFAEIQGDSATDDSDGSSSRIFDSSEEEKEKTEQDKGAVTVPSKAKQSGARHSRSGSDFKRTRRLRVGVLEGTTFLNNYIVIDTLGKGSFGKVKLCLNVADDGLYAVKVIDKFLIKQVAKSRQLEGRFRRATTDAESTAPLAELRRELDIMRALSHPNLVKLYEVIDDKESGKILLVVEYCEAGALVRPGQLTPERRMPEAIAQFYFRQMAAGLAHLHLNGVVHGDVKPENMLLSGDAMVKIADFGQSRFMEQGDDTLRRTLGTPAYLSPEICKGGHYSGRAADVWALGVSLYSFIYGELPFKGDSLLDLYENILSEEPSFPEHVPVSMELQDLLLRALCKEPTARISAAELLRHPWVQEEDLITLMPSLLVGDEAFWSTSHNAWDHDMHHQHHHQHAPDASPFGVDSTQRLSTGAREDQAGEGHIFIKGGSPGAGSATSSIQGGSDVRSPRSGQAAPLAQEVAAAVFPSLQDDVVMSSSSGGGITDLVSASSKSLPGDGGPSIVGALLQSQPSKNVLASEKHFTALHSLARDSMVIPKLEATPLREDTFVGKRDGGFGGGQTSELSNSQGGVVGVHGAAESAIVPKYTSSLDMASDVSSMDLVERSGPSDFSVMAQQMQQAQADLIGASVASPSTGLQQPDEQPPSLESDTAVPTSAQHTVLEPIMEHSFTLTEAKHAVKRPNHDVDGGEEKETGSGTTTGMQSPDALGSGDLLHAEDNNTVERIEAGPRTVTPFKRHLGGGSFDSSPVPEEQVGTTADSSAGHKPHQAPTGTSTTVPEASIVATAALPAALRNPFVSPQGSLPSPLLDTPETPLADVAAWSSSRELTAKASTIAEDSSRRSGGDLEPKPQPGGSKRGRLDTQETEASVGDGAVSTPDERKGDEESSSAATTAMPKPRPSARSSFRSFIGRISMRREQQQHHHHHQLSDKQDGGVGKTSPRGVARAESCTPAEDHVRWQRYYPGQRLDYFAGKCSTCSYVYYVESGVVEMRWEAALPVPLTAVVSTALHNVPAVGEREASASGSASAVPLTAAAAAARGETGQGRTVTFKQSDSLESNEDDAAGKWANEHSLRKIDSVALTVPQVANLGHILDQQTSKSSETRDDIMASTLQKATWRAATLMANAAGGSLDNLLLSQRHPGQYIGALSMLDPGYYADRWRAYAVAASECVVIRMTRQGLDVFLAQNPLAQVHLRASMARGRSEITRLEALERIAEVQRRRERRQQRKAKKRTWKLSDVPRALAVPVGDAVDAAAAAAGGAVAVASAAAAAGVEKAGVAAGAAQTAGHDVFALVAKLREALLPESFIERDSAAPSLSESGSQQR